jgi:hypothetical protein
MPFAWKVDRRWELLVRCECCLCGFCGLFFPFFGGSLLGCFQAGSGCQERFSLSVWAFGFQRGIRRFLHLGCAALSALSAVKCFMCMGFMLQCVFIRQVSRFEHIHGIIFLSIEAVVVGMNLFEVVTFRSAGCTEDQLWTGCADALIAVKSLFQQLAPEGPYARDAQKKTIYPA